MLSATHICSFIRRWHRIVGIQQTVSLPTDRVLALHISTPYLILSQTALLFGDEMRIRSVQLFTMALWPVMLVYSLDTIGASEKKITQKVTPHMLMQLSTLICDSMTVTLMEVGCQRTNVVIVLSLISHTLLSFLSDRTLCRQHTYDYNQSIPIIIIQ